VNKGRFSRKLYGYYADREVSTFPDGYNCSTYAVYAKKDLPMNTCCPDYCDQDCTYRLSPVRCYIQGEFTTFEEAEKAANEYNQMLKTG